MLLFYTLVCVLILFNIAHADSIEDSEPGELMQTETSLSTETSLGTPISRNTPYNLDSSYTRSRPSHNLEVQQSQHGQSMFLKNVGHFLHKHLDLCFTYTLRQCSR